MSVNCTNFTPDQCNELAVLMANVAAFDSEVSHAVFLSCLQTFGIGLGVGLIIALIRKLR